MSAFSDSDFASSKYSDFRPTYNDTFFNSILHTVRGDVALDIGCGTGQVTNELSGHFNKVIGTDLSPKMIQTATERNVHSNVVYKTSQAEEIPFIETNTIDLITCGQACHWFNHEKWFQEMYRILKRDGVLIYFGYADPVFVGEPVACNELLEQIQYGDDWLGPYWEQPGREILRDLLVQVDQKIPLDKFQVVERAKFTGSGANTTKLQVEREMKFGDFINYISTWSSLHSYQKRFPQGKVTERVFSTYHTRFGWDLNKPLKVVWKTCYTVARKL